MITEREGALDLSHGPATIEFDHVDFSYPSATEVSLASLESVAVLEATDARQVLFDVTFRAEPGQLVVLDRTVRCWQDDDHPPRRAAS